MTASRTAWVACLIFCNPHSRGDIDPSTSNVTEQSVHPRHGEELLVRTETGRYATAVPRYNDTVQC